MTNLSLRGILDILDEYQVTLRKVSNAIEWKYNNEDNTAWRILFTLDELRGSEVQLDVSETHIIWKLNNQFEWLDLVSIEDIVMLDGTGYLEEIEERIVHLEDLTTNLLKGYFRGQPVAPINTKEEMFQFLPMPNDNPNKSTSLIGLNALALWPIDVKYPCALSQLSVTVTTARTNALLNIALYDSDPITGLPNNLLFKSDELVCSSTGQKTCSKATFLTPGRYWIGRYAYNSTVGIVLRSYNSNVCDFLSSFSSIAKAAGTGTADQIYNSLYYSNTDILESLSGAEYSYANVPHTVYGKISSLFDAMMGSMTYNGTTLSGPLYDIIKASDNNYYILSENKVYRSADLSSFTEIAIDGAITTGFKTICEVAGNRLVIADQDTLFIKHFGNDEQGFIKSTSHTVTNENAVGLYINGSPDSSKVFVTHANAFSQSCQVTVFDLDDDSFIYNRTINTPSTTNKPYTKPIKFATDSFIIASSSDEFGYAIVRCDAVNPIETLTSGTLIDTNIVFTQTASYIYAVGRNSAEEMFCLKIEDVEGTLTSTEKTFTSVNSAEITSIQAMNDDVFVFGGSDYYWTDNYFDSVYLLTSIPSTRIANASILEGETIYFVNNDATDTIYRTTKFERPEA